jgi:hypothetical protein
MNFKIPLADDFKYLLSILYNKHNKNLIDDFEDEEDDSNWEIIYQR